MELTSLPEEGLRKGIATLRKQMALIGVETTTRSSLSVYTFEIHSTEGSPPIYVTMTSHALLHDRLPFERGEPR